MKQWISAKEAAALVQRHPSRIYRWIESGMLASQTASDGTVEVSSQDAMRIESVTVRGRPRGAADKNPTRRKGVVAINRESREH